ncbi:MAG: phosphodiester glycosidase family protein [Chitinophagales bacterium]
MKQSILYLFPVLLLVAFANFQQAAKQADTLTYRNHTFDVYHVDITQQEVKMYLEDEQKVKFHSLENLQKHLKQRGEKLIFATNGGMYLPPYDSEPQGLYVENGVERNPINLGDSEQILNFYMKPNGVFLLTENTAKVLESSQYPALKEKESVRYATQSGPMLVIEGQLHPKFNEGSTSTYIRSGVGILDDTHLVFAISNEKVNFWTFAMLFKEKLKCENALYLDGAISEMYLPALKRKQLGGDFGVMIGVSE